MSDIHTLAFVGRGVTVGKEVTIGPGATILGPCVIEDHAWIGPGAQLGGPPEMSSAIQNAAWNGDLQHAGVRIGAHAVIREGVVIHQGTYRETTVGARSWVLNRAYLAHDVVLGEDATISAGVSVGGHCVLGDRVNIGMNAVIHQRRVISDGAMIGMGTPVTRDVPPFAKIYGSPPRLMGVNTVGLERTGKPSGLADALLAYYAAHELFTSDCPLPDDLEPIREELLWWRAQNPLAPISASLAP